jgi:hypothetical protein
MRAAPTSCRFCHARPKSCWVVATETTLLAVYDHTQRKKEVIVTSNPVPFELTHELSATRKLGGSPFVIIAIALAKDFPALVWDGEDSDCEQRLSLVVGDSVRIGSIVIHCHEFDRMVTF